MFSEGASAYFGDEGGKQSLPHAFGSSLRQLLEAHTEGQSTGGHDIYNSVLAEPTGEAKLGDAAGDSSRALSRLR